MVPCPTLLTALALTIQVALDGPIGRLTECVGSALYMAPEVEQEAPYGVAADIFSFGALAYECFYYRANGEDFYEGMNLFTGLDVFREPVTSDPQQMPERPSACEDDAVWKCICDCLMHRVAGWASGVCCRCPAPASPPRLSVASAPPPLLGRRPPVVPLRPPARPAGYAGP